jgi:hypothetical protein
VLVQEQEDRQGLILVGSSQPVFNGQVGQKGFNFGGVHLLRMTLFVEENEAFYPVEVHFLSASGIMYDSQNLTNLVE